MTLIRKTLLAGAIGASAFTLSAVSASADVACVGPVCWHAHEHYDYPPSARVVVHNDTWKWKEHEHYRWREHEGRGYWRGDHWVEFH
jgi:hypothetical protein